MRTNCLHPIEPLSIYRLLSRYSLRVNKDSNLLRHVLSECSLCSVGPVSPESLYAVFNTWFRKHIWWCSCDRWFWSCKTQVRLIEFNIAKEVLIGSNKVRHLLGAGPIVQNSNVKVSFDKGWVLSLDAYLKWKSISVYHYRQWILFFNALAEKIDKITQGSPANENNWLCVEVYEFGQLLCSFLSQI